MDKHRNRMYMDLSFVEYYLHTYKLGKILIIGSFGKVKLTKYIPIDYKVAIKIINW